MISITFDKVMIHDIIKLITLNNFIIDRGFEE